MFATQIEFDLRMLQRRNEILEFLPDLQRSAFGRFTHIVVVEPCGRGGLQDEDIVDLLAQAHHRANARDVIVQDVVVFPPRSGAREHRRIVEFANPVEAHVADMLVHKVHPQHHLPVGEALHILKGSLPARASICFAQYPLAAELVRDAAHLLDRTDIAELGMHILLVELIEQHVDTGGLLPRGHRHVVDHSGHVGPAVFPIMSRPRNALFVAITRPRFGPAVDEHIVEQREVIVPYPFPIAHLLVQCGQLVAQVVAVTRPECFE